MWVGSGWLGTKHWTKPGTAGADFARDSYDCAPQHQETYRSIRPYQGYKEGVRVSEALYRARLEARGYQRVHGGQHWPRSRTLKGRILDTSRRPPH